MIGKFRVLRISAAAPLEKVVQLLEETADSHGFEITEKTDLSKVYRKQTNEKLSSKIVLFQMHQPSMTMSSALLEDMTLLILPLRAIVQEIEAGKTALYFPNWDLDDEAELNQAKRCMNVMYSDTLKNLAAALKNSLDQECGPCVDAVLENNQDQIPFIEW
jgi:uncharacterized protein (DUF302 family)